MITSERDGAARSVDEVETGRNEGNEYKDYKFNRRACGDAGNRNRANVVVAAMFGESCFFGGGGEGEEK